MIEQSTEYFNKIKKTLTYYLNPQNKVVEKLQNNFEDYLISKEACLYAKRSSKVLFRLFKLFDLDVKEFNKKYYYKKSDLEHLNTLKKPKGMKAIGLGNIHKAVIDRLQRKNINIELEKRFENFNLPFDIYIPDHNLTIEIQGPQHFFYSLNWSNNDVDKAKSTLISQIERDNAKIKFCEDNNIKHIWITVDDDIDDLFSLLSNNMDVKNLKWLERKHPDFSLCEEDLDKWLDLSYRKDVFLKNYVD